MRVEIDHVAIRTTEFDKARAFFEDVFPCSVIGK